MKRIIIIELLICTFLLVPAYLQADRDCAVEWINICQPCGNEDLSNRDDCAMGFYNKITGSPLNYTRRFAWGNGNAWEKDFKDQELSPTGIDHDWIDKVDIAHKSKCCGVF